MCLRIEQTVNGNVDRMEATANLGLLSAVELWLGIIVACMPTMAPFVRRYVQPGLSKLSQKLRGNSCQSTKQVNPRLQLRTFGGSGPPNSKKHNNYTELSDTSTFAAQSSDELRLVANDTHKLRTDCGFNQVNSALVGTCIGFQRLMSPLVEPVITLLFIASIVPNFYYFLKVS